jgi:hypothetical protein
MASDKHLSGFNQVSSFVRHLLAFGSFAGETPALPAMRSELCWTMKAESEKIAYPKNQALAFSVKLAQLLAEHLLSTNQRVGALATPTYLSAPP